MELEGQWAASRGCDTRREVQRRPRIKLGQSSVWAALLELFQDSGLFSTSLKQLKTGFGQFPSAAPVPFSNFLTLSSQKEINRKEMILAPSSSSSSHFSSPSSPCFTESKV